VSRQEIAERIWGKDKYIEAEEGINTAVRKIRRAIDDNADEPHYIQTFVGRGYQFIGDVKDVEDEERSRASLPPALNKPPI